MLVNARLRKWLASWAVVHDPHAQWRAQAFATVADVRAHLTERGSLPRLIAVRADEAENVASFAYELGTCTLVLDELDLACNGKSWAAPSVRQVVHYGRHRRVDLLGAFRFTRNVNEDLPSLADYVFVLRHSAAATYDLRTLEQRFGTTVAERATTIADHHCMIWRDT